MEGTQHGAGAGDGMKQSTQLCVIALIANLGNMINHPDGVVLKWLNLALGVLCVMSVLRHDD